jgi:hypothetical protein
MVREEFQPRYAAFGGGGIFFGALLIFIEVWA